MHGMNEASKSSPSNEAKSILSGSAIFSVPPGTSNPAFSLSTHDTQLVSIISAIAISVTLLIICHHIFTLFSDTKILAIDDLFRKISLCIEIMV